MHDLSPSLFDYVVSTKATDDFTVRIFDQTSPLHSDLSLCSVYIGFAVIPASFDSIRVLSSRHGFLLGSRVPVFGRGAPFRSGLVRCVVDRVALSVSFYKDGVYYANVEWKSLAQAPTHAYVAFERPGVSVELL